MVMVTHVGKVVHLPMALVVQTLQLVITLVFVLLNLVEKLDVMKTKVVVYVKEVARTVKEMLVFLLVKTHVNMVVNQHVNKVVNQHVNKAVKVLAIKVVSHHVNKIVKVLAIKAVKKRV